jgi:hypothetical protein
MFRKNVLYKNTDLIGNYAKFFTVALRRIYVENQKKTPLFHENVFGPNPIVSDYGSTGIYKVCTVVKKAEHNAMLQIT